MEYHCFICLNEIDEYILKVESEDFQYFLSKLYNYSSQNLTSTLTHENSSLFCFTCLTLLITTIKKLKSLEELEREIRDLKYKFEENFRNGSTNTNLYGQDNSNSNCNDGTVTDRVLIEERKKFMQYLGIFHDQIKPDTTEILSSSPVTQPEEPDPPDFSDFDDKVGAKIDENLVLKSKNNTPNLYKKELVISLKKLQLQPGRTSFNLLEPQFNYNVKILKPPRLRHGIISKPKSRSTKRHTASINISNASASGKRKRIVNAKSQEFVHCSYTANCLFKTRSQSLMKAHVRRIHLNISRKYFECTVCQYHAKSIKSLDDHTRKHTGEKPFICDVCGFACVTNQGLKSHKLNHDESLKIYHCSYENCEKKYPTISRLKSHETIHSNQNSKYVCQICGKIFSCNAYLKVHIKSHEETESLTCTVCGKILGTINSLNEHMMHHENNKPFACTLCEKKYIKKKLLKDHIKFIHEGVKAYQCTVCPKKYSKRLNLKVHMRVHTGERPYKCLECEKSFFSRDILLGHQRIHKKEDEFLERFPCPVCKKEFLRKDYLYQHNYRNKASKCLLKK